VGGRAAATVLPLFIKDAVKHREAVHGYQEPINNLNMMTKILIAPVLVIILLVLFGLALCGPGDPEGRAERYIQQPLQNYQVSAQLVNELTDVHMNTTGS